MPPKSASESVSNASTSAAKAASREKASPSQPPVDPIVLEMCEMVGNIMGFWGFRKVMGKIWTLLYLSPEPLSASDIRKALSMSVGNVSMALKELEHWGVIKKALGPSPRREYYEAETHLWKMISRVFRERERMYVENALEKMRELQEELKGRTRLDADDRELQQFRRGRIEQLMQAAQIALKLLDALVATARIDASPLRNFRLVKDFPFRKRR